MRQLYPTGCSGGNRESALVHCINMAAVNSSIDKPGILRYHYREGTLRFFWLLSLPRKIVETRNVKCPRKTTKILPWISIL